jgi:glyoxalase family protein
VSSVGVLITLVVNFDDPGTYHLYYGDGVGGPDMIITFFPWLRAPRGRRGTGQVTTASFLNASNVVDYWTKRLNSARNFSSAELATLWRAHHFFSDPDRLALELIASDDAVAAGSYGSGKVPPE